MIPLYLLPAMLSLIIPWYKDEIEELLKSHTTDAQMVSIAQNENITFDEVIGHLQNISRKQELFDKFVKDLYERGVLDIDDYTLAFL